MTTNEQDIVAGLAEIVEEVTGVEPVEVTLDKKLIDDLDIDSLSMVEIAVQTEDKYGIEIPDEKMKRLQTVKDVVQFIRGLSSRSE